jgi:hypothetical protein
LLRAGMPLVEPEAVLLLAGLCGLARSVFFVLAVGDLLDGMVLGRDLGLDARSAATLYPLAGQARAKGRSR